jgi:hypothetical protein
MSYFKCKFAHCSHSSTSKKSLLEHILLAHSNDPNFRINCIENGCFKYFKKYKDFYDHVTDKNHGQICDNYDAIVCDICSDTFNSLSNLKLHYHSHIKDDKIPKPLKCLILGCTYEVKDINPFKKHFSSQHYYANNSLLRTELCQMNGMDYQENSNSIETNFYDVESNIDCTSNNFNDVSLQSDDLEGLREFYMRCYLKFKDKLLVPESTCEIIFSSFFSLINLHNKDISNGIRNYTNTYSADKEISELFIHFIDKNTVLSRIQNEFKLKSNRLKWIENNKFYVKPKTIFFDSNENDNDSEDENVDEVNHLSHELATTQLMTQGEDDSEDEMSSESRDALFAKYEYILKGKKASYQYVPILKLINALLLNPDIQQAYFESVENAKHTRTINSFYQSESFKRKSLFALDISGIQLKFFIDGYSNCNPLGDARSSFKVTPIMFKIGNLHRRFQSVDYFTQVT